MLRVNHFSMFLSLAGGPTPYYDEESSEDNSWIVPAVATVVVVIILFFVIVISCILYKRSQASKQRVTPTSKGEVLMISNAPAATHSAKRLTTHELLAELQARYGHREMNKKPKVSRKHQEAYGMEDGFDSHSSPHPPPYGISQNGGTAGHPAYPPKFFGISANEATTNAPMPNMAPQSQLPPLKKPTAPPMETRSIPGPSRYLTPAEARAGGTISDPREIKKVVEITG